MRPCCLRSGILFLIFFQCLLSTKAQNCNCPAPSFLGIPVDTLVSCSEVANLIISDLSFSNNESDSCQVNGSVPGVISGEYDICGGSLSVIWTYRDTCGNTITHTQNITVTSAHPVSFINPPLDTVIDCSNGLTIDSPELAYSNGETGSCEISGTVPGIITGDPGDCCGDVLQRSWEFTDSCGNIIIHNQLIYLINMDDQAPSFVDVPADIIVSCIFDVPPGQDLTWIDNCDGEGVVSSIDIFDGNSCPEIITRTWTAQDFSGNETSATQFIIVIDDIAPVFLNPPANISVDTLPPMTTLAWTDNCDGAGIISGVDVSDGGSNPEIITRTWTYSDACGNFTIVTQLITIQSPGYIECSEAFHCTDMGPPIFTTVEEFVNSGGFVNFPCTVADSSIEFLGLVIIDNFSCPQEVYNYEITDVCGNKATCELLSFGNDNIAPVWTSSPTQIDTIACGILPEQEDLTAMDDCGFIVTKSVDPFIIDLNNGYFVTYRWALEDICGNTAEDQTMTFFVEPVPPVSFIAPPADTNLFCVEVAQFEIPTLAYSNGEIGACEVSGAVQGVLSGGYGICGGMLIITWSFTDSIGRSITYSQSIIIHPTNPVRFLNPPGDTILDYEDALFYFPQDLSYSNHEGGNCEISGTVPGFLTSDFDESGGSISVTWQYVDSCGGTLVHVIHITVNPLPTSTFGLSVGSKYRLMPNPVAQGAYILLTADHSFGDVRYKIADARGSTIARGKVVNPIIDSYQILASFDPGLYYFIIEVSDGRFVIPFVVFN